MKRDELRAWNAAKRLTDKELDAEVRRTEARWANRHENPVTRDNGLYMKALRAEACQRTIMKGGAR